VFTIRQLQTITNGTNGYDAQAFPDSSDFSALVSGIAAAANASTGGAVVTGCVLTAKTPASMIVSLSAGQVRLNGTAATVPATTLTVSAASTTDRRDIVYYPHVVTGANLGTLYVTGTLTGTNATMSASSATAATATHTAGNGSGLQTTKWYRLALGHMITSAAGLTTIPAFGTGHGAVFGTSLGGKAFAAGTWSLTVKLHVPSGTLTIKAIHLRVGFKNGASYRQIGSDIVDSAGLSIGTAAQTVTISGSLPASTAPGATTRLYVEAWMLSGTSKSSWGLYLGVGAALCPLVTPTGTIKSVGILAGTPCAVAGWTRNSSTPPPMKPAIPATGVLLAEVYVPGSASSIAAKNIVDKRCIV